MPLSQGVDLDSVSATVIAGEGAAGTPVGGVVSIQGVASGTVVPVTGTLGALIFDSTGDPLNSQNQNLFVADLLQTTGQGRAQSVTTTAALLLGGASALTNRKVITARPTNGTIYYGYANTVTTTNGFPVFANESISFAVSTSTLVWVISAGTVDVRVTEA